MKFDRTVLQTIEVPDGEDPPFLVDIVLVEIRQKEGAPVLVSEQVAMLQGSAFLFSPDAQEWRDATGQVLAHDYISKRGIGRLQRAVVEGVSKAWTAATKAWTEGIVPVSTTVKAS